MFKLASNITITGTKNKITFDYVAEVDIATSVRELTDVAIVQFPKKISWKGKDLFDFIRKGDKIFIELGYNGSLNTVFEGYIRKVTNGIPLKVECEDAMYLLKQVKIPAKHYPSLTVKQFFSEHCPSSVTYDVADFNLGEVRLQNEPSFAKVLDYIRSEYGMNFYFRSGKLYGVLPSIKVDYETHLLGIQQNIVSDNLEYVLADDVKVIIKAKAILKDNKKIEVQEPKNESDGEIRTFHCSWATNETELRKFAQEKLATFKVNHMTGSIIAFGEPFILKGDTIDLRDNKNPERDRKKFIVDAVRYTFGQNGYRQHVELGMQLS